MAAGLNEYLDDLRQGCSDRFSPSPYYERESDSVVFYARDEQSYAKRLNDQLTIFVSTHDDSLVGCEVKGVTRMLKIAGDYGVVVLDKKIKLGILLAFAIALQPEDPAAEQYDEELKNSFRDVEFDREQLALA